MKINFIRHGKTHGNLEKRYIGVTDEPLCDTGIKELENRKYPDCDIVVLSPMKRCIQTAEILYPDKKKIIIDSLSECDFGKFEGKNYHELSCDADYIRWVESGGMTTFPNGENPYDFRKRCIDAFYEAINKCQEYKALSFVVHGGTIMSIFERFAEPEGDYFDFQVANGCGYICEYEKEKLMILEKI